MTDPSTASLLAEIDDLKRKLDVSARWMKREVQQSAHKIVARKVTKMSENDRMDFMKENQEEIIANRIR